MTPGGNDKPTRVVGMERNPIIGRVWQAAEPLCRSEGVELVHVEFQSEPGGRTLRVFLDKTGGITLDDCVHISRQLGDILDVALDMEAAYRMEVSSPGVPRPVGRLDDFTRFQGCKAKIRTAKAIDGQKNFTGTLEGVDETVVRIRLADRIMNIPFDEIVKAHLIQPNGENACS